MEFRFSVPLVAARSKPPAGSRAATTHEAASANPPAALGTTHKFALDSRLRGTRRSSGRARTGCATCKKRHVKCDETKPECLNCLKSRGHCDGYSNSTTDSKAFRATAASTTTDAYCINVRDTPLVLTEPSVNTIRFATSEQRAYFDEWTGISLTFLSGNLSQSPLWTTIMPQLTLNEPTLRYAAMAVGALRRAYNVQGTFADLTTSNKHYLNAVALYCEALRRQAKAEPTKSGLRTALLSSLLFICFEAQRGNIPAALKHITHGFGMLNELAACTDIAPGLVSIAPAPPALVQQILDCYKPLELQSRTFMSPLGRSLAASRPQPPPQIPEESPTTPAYSLHSDPAAQSPSSQPGTPWQSRVSPPSPHVQGLPSPATTGSPQSDHARTTPPPERTRPPGIAPFTKSSPYFRPRQTNVISLDEMPHAFKSFGEAGSYWSLVQRSMVQYLPLLTMTTAQLALPRATSDAEVEAKLASVKQNPKIAKFIAESRYWLQRWIEAYEPYYQTVCRHAQDAPQPYLQAINLRVEYLILYIYTATPRFNGLIAARGLTRQFREINEMVTILLSSRPTCGFAMDSGWAWPLFISSFACRDPDVREESIRILGQYPMRNALRDSRVLRAIALKNRDVEAISMLDGTENDHWLRLRRREVMFENFGESVIFRSMQRLSNGQYVLVEEIADLRVRDDGWLNWRQQPISSAISTLAGVC